MDKKPFIQQHKRVFCCCFTADEEDYDSKPVTLKRIDSEISPSILEPAIYASKIFAVDKIYFLNSGQHKFLVSFRHIIVESTSYPLTTQDNPNNIPEEYWKERYRIFSRYDEGIQICENAWAGEILEKIGKIIARQLVSRLGAIQTCLVCMSGVGSLAIQLSKTMKKVIALEDDETQLECLYKNREIYEVNDFLYPIHGNLLSYSPDNIPEIIIIIPKINIPKSVQVSLSNHFPELANYVEKSLSLSKSLVFIFPPTLDPYDFIDSLKDLDIDPLVEFLLIFDNNHLKNIVCLIGKVVILNLPDIVNSILSRIGLGSKQREFMFKTIEEFGIKKTLHILEDVEKDVVNVSAIDKLKTKSRKFVENVLKIHKSCGSGKIDNAYLDGITVLYKGKDGDDVARIMEEMNIFFIELDGSQETVVEIDSMVLKGYDEIVQYLEYMRIKDSPNKNSLFALIGS
ncbi:hypothetical protein SteCoe_17009 [Stentor coeruleus]|uniref:Trimethylguanosine synthase n=1 Tax=Stentor coeruleus TaxID=5963 RepID=A0A1R2C042_9CILI|nr:hypothetical protein SteCoe_17009 [Stentor coeruleus]